MVRWSRDGQQQANSTDPWLHAVVAVAPTVESVLRITGVTGGGYRSDMAIDAIQMIGSSGDNVSRSNDTWRPYTFSAPWRQSQSGRTPSANTGPDAVYNSSNGNGTLQRSYLYTEASSNFGAEGTIDFDQPLAAGSVWTLQFWYHMYGADMGVLSVELGRATTPNAWCVQDTTSIYVIA